MHERLCKNLLFIIIHITYNITQKLSHSQTKERLENRQWGTLWDHVLFSEKHITKLDIHDESRTCTQDIHVTQFIKGQEGACHLKD